MTESEQVTGALRLALKDFAARPGVAWALPSITARTGAIVVENTQYGSLCRYAVAGDAQIQGSTVTLTVSFAERLTLCTAEIRALTYTATISGVSGTYDVNVVHAIDGRSGSVASRRIVVP